MGRVIMNREAQIVLHQGLHHAKFWVEQRLPGGALNGFKITPAGAASQNEAASSGDEVISVRGTNKPTLVAMAS
jgi:hypothetical protein